MKLLTASLAIALAAGALAQTPYKPSPKELEDNYARANGWNQRTQGTVLNSTLRANWFSPSEFWYRREAAGGAKSFVVVNADRKSKGPAFDHAKLAAAIAAKSGDKVEADKLPFNSFSYDSTRKAVLFDFKTERWKVDLDGYTITVEGAAQPAEPAPGTGQGRGRQGGGGAPQGPQGRSADGKWTASIKDEKLVITNAIGEATTFEPGPISSFQWAPDSKHIFGYRLIPGDRKLVYLIQSSNGSPRGALRQRMYDQPGDKLDTFEVFLFDVETKTNLKVAIDPILGGGQPWSAPPRADWFEGGKTAVFDYMDRGYTRMRYFGVDVASGAVRTIIDDQPTTFFDTTNQIIRLLQKSSEIIWRSERDGWGNLYLIDGQTGAVKNQITKGEWVTRELVNVDEDKREITFTANNVPPRGGFGDSALSARDPYFIRYYRAKFDGTGLTELTPGPGTHTAEFSPDRRFVVDTYSRVDLAPVHELRSAADGSLLVKLESADDSRLKSNGVPLPEVFVAKGRDGKTDIWGIVCRPSHWRKDRTYPIIENIYAGPHDSFVPKRFTPSTRMQSLAELGFIVVQVDGMGTRNRGKKFHDVCWKNIADAGFPDRILWMKALAAKDKTVDVSRVGIYGTSAGGQNSAGALLFHPEFYKVAVSSCGCHDNRMDKYWWNEQWMGYPVGPHYEAQSNITNAGKLQGKLLLMVGELDTNVPPESTYKFADALIKAGKDFDFLALTGMDHTDGGTYGERRRRDYFVRHLLGVEPPSRNGP